MTPNQFTDLEAARQFLPSNAENLRSFGTWVLTYDQRGTRSDGTEYTRTETDFLNVPYCRELAAELGEGWSTDEDPDNVRWCGILVGGQNLRMQVSTRTYGAQKCKRISIDCYVKSESGTAKTVEKITVSAEKKIKDVARDIQRRILPKVAAVLGEVTAKDKAQRDAEKELSDKLDKLRKKYPGLRFDLRKDGFGITVDSKYGAKISLHGYTYPSNTPSGARVWCLTGDRSALKVDDIDSAPGRALLKLLSEC